MALLPGFPCGIALLSTACLLLAACARVPVDPGEREIDVRPGVILDTRTSRVISREALLARALATHSVIMGETHDNAEHHRLQAWLLEAMLRAGRRPALAMEQFDREFQPALDKAHAEGWRDAELIANAAAFDRKGWRWPDYKPLVELAAAQGLPIVAANFSRDEARALMKSGRPAAGPEPATAALRASLEADIVEGHCGHRPPAALLTGMVEAQRARDWQMAQALLAPGTHGVVLIAGAGHARRDRGAPAYLEPAAAEKLLSIAFVETDSQAQPSPDRYAAMFDIVWFTSSAEREDPCRSFRPRSGG